MAKTRSRQPAGPGSGAAKKLSATRNKLTGKKLKASPKSSKSSPKSSKSKAVVKKSSKKIVTPSSSPKNAAKSKTKIVKADEKLTSTSFVMITPVSRGRVLTKSVSVRSRSNSATKADKAAAKASTKMKERRAHGSASPARGDGVKDGRRRQSASPAAKKRLSVLPSQKKIKAVEPVKSDAASRSGSVGRSALAAKPEATPVAVPKGGKRGRPSSVGRQVVATKQVASPKTKASGSPAKSKTAHGVTSVAKNKVVSKAIHVETDTVSEFTRPSLISNRTPVGAKKKQQVEPVSTKSIQSAQRGLKRKRSPDKSSTGSEDVEVPSATKRLRTTGASIRDQQAPRQSMITKTSVLRNTKDTAVEKPASYGAIDRNWTVTSADSNSSDAEMENRTEVGKTQEAQNGTDASELVEPSRWEIPGKASRLFDSLWRSRRVATAEPGTGNKEFVSSSSKGKDADKLIEDPSTSGVITSTMSYHGEPVVSDRKVGSTTSVRKLSRQPSVTRAVQTMSTRGRREPTQATGAAARLLAGVEPLPVAASKGSTKCRQICSRRRACFVASILIAVGLIGAVGIMTVSYLYAK